MCLGLQLRSDAAAAASSAADTTRSAATTASRRAGRDAGEDKLNIRHLDLRLTTAHRDHFRRSEHIGAISLFDSADDHPELRVSQNARESPQRGGVVTQTIRDRSRGNQRRTRKREDARRVGRAWSTVQRRSQIALHCCRTGNHVTHKPIEAEGLVVVLVDLSEPGLHQNLRRDDVQQLDSHLDDVQILQRSAHQQQTVAVIEEDLRRVRTIGHTQVHHSCGQKILADLIIDLRG